MNTSRHHADWLSLVEVSGPFVSLPVLLRVFPQGLDARDPAQAKALRAAYDEWQKTPTAPGRQRAWILHVLTDLLRYPGDLITEGQTLPAGLEANVAQMGETLRPDFALVGPKNTDSAGRAHILITAYPANQSLDKPVTERHWKANPATRMMELLHVSGVSLGLVTNGEQWMLVYAPRSETTGYASWYGALWLDEPITLRAFHSLLGVHRFFGVAAANTLLGLLKESAQDQQEVTDQLGYQVREAVQVLVQAFDTLDQDSNRTLLKGLAETDLYDAALTVMMRLVFLFSAEERGLLHLGKPLYDDNYAVSTLMEQLQEVADLYGPQVLERRCDAWARLLATFRAVHGGVNHQDLLMPAYGGSLFDPDRYPFLEGRAVGTKWANTPAELLDVNNRVVLHLLSSLQRLRMKVPGGGPSESRRISFRALGVEQIGHVYEGLLDHTAVRAKEPVLGMKGTRDKETEIPLAKLEATLAKGRDELVEFLHDETGRSDKAISRALDEGTLNEEHRLLIACGHDAALLQRVRNFAGLIREDSFERPVVVLPGSIYVTAGTTRRSTGTHYTPPSLTEPIVQHTLEPLVYRGPSEGLPQSEWQLKFPKEILDLKVCDMAMGSGAFLVQACRYLSERLVESWENEEKKHPNEILITPEGGFSEGVPSERLIPTDATERLAIARRIVADRCLYGVDINPMAVEMAKLSMWLITLDGKRPFTFLDHAFKCGDSLLGLSSFKQLEDFSMRPEGVKQVAFSTMNLWRHVEEAKKKRQMLETMSSDTPEQVTAKAMLCAESEEAVVKLIAASDILLAVELKALKGSAYETELETAADRMMYSWAKDTDELNRYARSCIGSRRTFHWPFAFPEIMGNGGFDVFVGNPPFIGNKYWAERLGNTFQAYAELLTGGKVGKIDVVALFFRRVFSLLSEHGRAGLIATTTAREGATQEVGFGWISKAGEIYRASSQRAWPGQAGVHVCIVWFGKAKSALRRVLDDYPVESIPPSLVGHTTSGKPYQLCNAPWGFQGSHNGKGECFTLTVNDHWFVRLMEARSPFLRPYITGDDITTGAYRKPPRWCVDCQDLTLDQIRSMCSETYRFLSEVAQPVRTAEALAPYRGLIDRWWQMWNHRAPLYRELRKQELCLAMPMVAKHLDIAQLPTRCVFTNKVCVLNKPTPAHLSVLLSSFFESWVIEHGGTMGAGRLTIVLSTGIQTFPMPAQFTKSMDMGETYYANLDSLMLSRTKGFTDIQNSFHSPTEKSAEIQRLRHLHVELDQAVAEAYGWSDLKLGHDFHETKQGIRFTLSDSDQKAVLDRLLALNHQRHAQEEAEEMLLGKQPKATGKRGSKKSDVNPVPALSLFEKE